MKNYRIFDINYLPLGQFQYTCVKSEKYFDIYNRKLESYRDTIDLIFLCSGFKQIERITQMKTKLNKNCWEKLHMNLKHRSGGFNF